jgi:hypothetical protein
MRSADLRRGLTAIALACAALAAGRPAYAGWPNALPAQPLVQAPRICAPNIVALNRRCKVVDFAKLGQTADGRDWYYAFFGTRWADRHGRMERGFPVVFYLQPPATLRLSFWINDEPGLDGRWAMTPPPRPILMQRPDGDYLGFTLKAIRGPDDQRLVRRDKLRWTKIDILHRSEADQAKLDAITPRGCEGADDGFYDWTSFRLVLALRERLSHAPCGVAFAELEVKDAKLALVSATYSKASSAGRTPPPIPPFAAPAPLTSAAGGHTSPSR